VLGRRVETMVLREILRHARAAGVDRVVGTYSPTERNALVRDHYEKLGFTKLAEHADGTTMWQMSVSEEIAPAPMEIRRTGFSTAAGED